MWQLVSHAEATCLGEKREVTALALGASLGSLLRMVGKDFSYFVCSVKRMPPCSSLKVMDLSLINNMKFFSAKILSETFNLELFSAQYLIRSLNVKNSMHGMPERYAAHRYFLRLFIYLFY